MISTRRPKHPNCMYKWMDWMHLADGQRQVAEYFGEAPANPKACAELDKTTARTASCDTFHVDDEAFYNASVLEDARGRLRRRPGQTCIATTTGSRPGPRSRPAAEPAPPAIHESRRTPGLRPGVQSATHDRDDRRSRGPASRRPQAARWRAALPPAARSSWRCCWRRRSGWLGRRLPRVAGASCWSRRSGRSTAHRQDRPRASTLDNFAGIASEPVYRTVALRTLVIAAARHRSPTSLLAFPIAYYMARVASPRGPRSCSSCRACCRSGRATSSRSTPGA